MRYSIDEERDEIRTDDGSVVPLYSPEGFRLVSDLWLKIGWDQKHLYSFTWLGRPIIQIPDDAFRIQEVIYSLKPDVIVETGVAHGGSLVFYASLCKAMDKGRVIGVDIEIRPHNRTAIEAHELFSYVTLIEANSIDPVTVEQVRGLVGPGETVLVILDSCHSYEHVSSELDLYCELVTPGSYIVVTDGSQEYLGQTPRARREYAASPGWPTDNPKRAAEDFVERDGRFSIVEPEFPFQEGAIDYSVTLWPSAYLRREA